MASSGGTIGRWIAIWKFFFLLFWIPFMCCVYGAFWFCMCVVENVFMK